MAELTSEFWEKLAEVFEAVKECSPEGRPALIDEICADNEELKAMVTALIADSDQADLFFEKPIVEIMKRDIKKPTQ